MQAGKRPRAAKRRLGLAEPGRYICAVPNEVPQGPAMTEAFICDAVRTPIGRYGGALAAVRPDDLGTVPVKALMARNAKADWRRVDDVYFGCVNQAGEDCRNVARNVALLSGLPVEVGGVTVNRLCGSGMDATAQAARAIRTGEARFLISGGVESMSRAPFVMAKASQPFQRKQEIYDSTIGWRFPNPKMAELFGLDEMGATAENLAVERQISREDQDRFALASQAKTKAAQDAGRLASEIVPVAVPQRRGDPVVVQVDEHPRPETTMQALAKLRAAFAKDGTVTAGNASGVNDGACALLVASEDAATREGLTPRARILAAAAAGVPPRIMGIGPVPATRKVLERTGLTVDKMDVIELNEAFAAQSLAVTRELGLDDDDPRVNPNGGAIALGHPLGMSGARLVTTALYELERRKGRYALCTMCIGIGQGIAMVIERV
jgi:acetyl-CoA acyltransferase